jgi:hypothetical protein
MGANAAQLLPHLGYINTFCELYHRNSGAGDQISGRISCSSTAARAQKKPAEG